MYSNCTYTKKVHFTPESQKFHIDKCVMEKLTKMNDHKKCTAYYSGICHVNKLGNCNLDDIDNLCKSAKSEFTVGDAEKLCLAETSATTEFWKNKYGIKSTNYSDSVTVSVAPISMGLISKLAEL